MTFEFVVACPTCARGKSCHPTALFLQPLPVPSRPWSYNSLDFITGSPPLDGNTTIVDHFYKAVHFVPLTKLPSATERVQLLVHHVFHLHRIP